MINLLMGCGKFVQLDSAPTQINAKVVFSDIKTAHSAVVGIYTEMSGSTRFSGGLMTIYGGLLADELSPVGSNTDYQHFYSNAVPINSSIVSFNLWSGNYRAIYRANAIIEGLNSSDAIKEEQKAPLVGECLFLRAFGHFYLVNLLGDVPLITTSDYRITAVQGRSPREQVYKQIRDDLEKAIDLLPVAYQGTAKGRPNKLAANALLARVCLYLKDWEGAEKNASAVIGHAPYMIEPLEAVFKQDSRETIWQLLSSGNPAEANRFIPLNATSAPAIALEPGLVDFFDGADLRKEVWIREQTVSGVPYAYPFKYTDRNLTPVTQYLVVLRLAEQFLIRGEARARLGDFHGSKNDLSVIRERAGLSVSDDLSADNLPDFFISERRAELFAEWGHRWFDLARTGTLDAVMPHSNDGWKAYASLLPIPEDQLLVNVFLTQNPGYENQ